MSALPSLRSYPQLNPRTDRQGRPAWRTRGSGTRSGIFSVSLEGNDDLNASCLAYSQDGCKAHGAAKWAHGEYQQTKGPKTPRLLAIRLQNESNSWIWVPLSTYLTRRRNHIIWIQLYNWFSSTWAPLQLLRKLPLRLVRQSWGPLDFTEIFPNDYNQGPTTMKNVHEWTGSEIRHLTNPPYLLQMRTSAEQKLYTTAHSDRNVHWHNYTIIGAIKCRQLIVRFVMTKYLVYLYV